MSSTRYFARRVLSSNAPAIKTILNPTASLPRVDFKPEKYEGMTREEMTRVKKDHINPGIYAYYKKPVFIHQGFMQYLYDLEGKQYLDMLSGIATVNAGHCHPAIEEATVKQVKKLWHVSNLYMHPTIHEYAEKLVATLPDPLKVVYFVNSGSEAVDMALFMARMHTGCMDTFVLRGAYHGASPSAMGLTSLNTWHYNYPSTVAIHKMRCPDPYRGPWGGRNCRDCVVPSERTCSCSPGECMATEKYVEEVVDMLKFCAPKGKMGGLFIESIQGAGGTVQYPKGWVKRAFELVRERGGVCISDEVQTGFGRTGEHFWGFQSHDVLPDIVTMAKGIGNGFPLAAVVTTPEVASVMTRAVHFNTFGGSALACAVGSATLDVLQKENLQQNSHEMGIMLIKGINDLRTKFPIIGDIRGKGLMVALELVTNKETLDPIPANEMTDIMEDMKDMSILCGKCGVMSNVLRFKPPLCVNQDDIKYVLSCLGVALENNKQNYPR